jgi:hypothetical protein
MTARGASSAITQSSSSQKIKSGRYSKGSAMSSKILCLSDPHLTENSRDQYRHNFMHDLLGIIDRRKPDAVAILGDLTEEKDRHSAKLVNQIVGELGDIAAVMPLLMLMGNHDYRNEGHPFFAFTRHIPNVAWVDKVSTSIELPEEFRAIFDGCLFLPHTLDYERDWAGVDFQDFRFIFAHNTFAGAISNGRALDGVPAGIFPDNARVLSGDIHTPQKIGPVTYIGAPYTIDFGDDYDPRLMMVQDRSRLRHGHRSGWSLSMISRSLANTTRLTRATSSRSGSHKTTSAIGAASIAASKRGPKRPRSSYSERSRSCRKPLGAMSAFARVAMLSATRPCSGNMPSATTSMMKRSRSGWSS